MDTIATFITKFLHNEWVSTHKLNANIYSWLQSVLVSIRHNYVWTAFFLFWILLSIKIFRDLGREFSVWIRSRFLISLEINSGINSDHTTNGIVYRRLLTLLGTHCDHDLQRRQSSFFDPSSTNWILHFLPFKFDFSEEQDYKALIREEEGNFSLKVGVGYGVNYIQYKGTAFRLRRWTIKPGTEANPCFHCEVSSCGTAPMGQEMLTITTFFWNKAKLEEIIESIKPKILTRDSSKLSIYQPEWGVYWKHIGSKVRKRGLDTLIMDDNVLENVLHDVKRFTKSGDWYLSKGIPFRRNYLLHGPPGCGKSSMVKAIASELNYGICNFSMSKDLTDDRLIQLLSWTPKNCVILLEDIDAAFGSSSRKSTIAYEGRSASKVTLMGVLNALDGVASAENGQLVFMTTNYPERLDPALIRPGRVDVKIHMGFPTDSQVIGIFNRFYPDLRDEGFGNELARKIKALKEVKVTMAMLQCLFIVYRKDPREALENFEQHVKDLYLK